MANTKAVEELLHDLKVLADFDMERMIVRSEWGELNFEPWRGEIEGAFLIVNSLLKLPLEKLTEKTSIQIQKALDQLTQAFGTINGFSVTSNDAQQVRPQLAAKLQQSFQNLVGTAAPWIALYQSQGQQDVDIKKEAERFRAEASIALEEVKEQVRSKQKQADQLMSALQESVAASGAGVFSNEFKSRAEAAMKQSWGWLVGAAISTSATVALAFWLTGETWVKGDASIPQLVQLVTSKLFILGVMLSATIWTSKMYRIIRHQEAIDSHRSNALGTMAAFVRSAEGDPELKSAVMMEVTKCIFSPTASGFIDGKEEHFSSPQIVEVVSRASEAIQNGSK